MRIIIIHLLSQMNKIWRIVYSLNFINITLSIFINILLQVEVFWNLLYLCSKKSDSTNIVQCVKYHFASLLYRNAEFYALPDDMSYGSRELLLAFSWLLCKNQVLENHLKQELSKSDISKEFNLRFLNRSDNNEPLPTLQTIEDYFNYIMRLSGRINDNIKKLNEYKTKTLCLTTKVNVFRAFFLFVFNFDFLDT